MTRKLAGLSILLVALASCARVESGASPEAELTIGFVDNSNFQYVDGCGCTFHLPGEKPTPGKQLLILAAAGEKAWINVNGEIIELKKMHDGIDFQGKVGDKYEQRYESADTSVTVVCTATGIGDTHAVDCGARITVTRGSLSKTVMAEGSCGC